MVLYVQSIISYESSKTAWNFLMNKESERLTMMASLTTGAKMRDKPTRVRLTVGPKKVVNQLEGSLDPHKATFFFAPSHKSR